MKRLLNAMAFAAAGLLSASLLAGGAAEKKLNSINCAKILAERNIVETVYGVKIKFDEEVTNILEGSFVGTTETKTGKRTIKGIEFETPKYDSKRDIAQVTATLKLSSIADIVDREKFNIDKYPDKVIKRVAFATSTPENARKIAALRAAEIDAYKSLYKRIGGFTLESHTSVQNFALKSDKVKASVIGAIMGAEFVGFDWEGEGDEAIAVVKLRLNTKELNEMLGQKILDCDREFIEAEGHGVPKASEPSQAAQAGSSSGGKPLIKSDVAESNLNVLP